MANVSTVTPANLINTNRTAAANSASSTATPYDSGNIVTWSLPGQTANKLVNGTQSFSTQSGQVFTDFASGTIVPMPAQLPAGQSTFALVEGTPTMD